MRTVEEDVERVRAVHAALGEPLAEVWVAKWQNRDGDGFSLFRSEAGARAQLLSWLDEERSGLSWSDEDFAAVRADIELGGANQFDGEGDRWYSIDTEQVNS